MTSPERIPVIPPPAILDLPISNHADFYAKFIYKPVVVDGNGEPVLLNGSYQFTVADYPAGSSVTLIIDTDPVLEVEADITDETAEVLIDKAVTATIGIGSTWSLVLTFADGFDKAIMEGKVILTQKMVTK